MISGDGDDDDNDNNNEGEYRRSKKKETVTTKPPARKLFYSDRAGAVSKQPLSYKLCIVGDSGVGKTSVLRRYAKGEFETSQKSTIGIDLFMKDITVNERPLKVQLWDTAGQERFNSLSTTYFRGSAGLICVFDVSNGETLDSLDHWIDSYYCAIGKRSDDERSAPPPVLLLANKIDIPTNTDKERDSRVMLLERAVAKAQQHHWYMFQVSAKEGIEVNEAIDAFMDVVDSNSNEKLLSLKREEEQVRLRKEREERWARQYNDGDDGDDGEQEQERKQDTIVYHAKQSKPEFSVVSSSSSTTSIIKLQDYDNTNKESINKEQDKSHANSCCTVS